MNVPLFRMAVCAVMLSLAGPTTAQEAKPEFRFEFHGFAGASIYGQDFVANNQGGAATYAAVTPRTDKGSLGVDARQTRLNLSLTGPKVLGGATPRGIVEMDFLGQANLGTPTATCKAPVAPSTDPTCTITNVTSSSGFTNLTPRARVLAAELKWDNTILQFGQNSDLTGAVTPTSVGHIPNSLTYGGGTIGGRHAGVFVWHHLVLDENYKLELALQVTRSAYHDGTSGGGTFLSTAEASALPMVGVRAKLKHQIFEVSVGGHWNQVDLTGVGDSLTSAAGKSRDVVAGVIAAKVSTADFTVQGSGYVGKNLAQLSGGFGQIPTTGQNDLHEMGAWLQAGYNFTPEFSAWALMGLIRMTPSEVWDAQPLKTAANGYGIWGNTVTSVMLRYLEGGYALGLEYAHFETMYLAAPTASAAVSPNGVLAGNQLMLSGFYFF